jgi:hypothetical protein
MERILREKGVGLGVLGKTKLHYLGLCHFESVPAVGSCRHGAGSLLMVDLLGRSRLGG